MDSKSISRKGVGVRLPSLAPACAIRSERAGLEDAARSLGALLWPFIARDLRAAEEGLRKGREAETGERVRRSGWCLGVLSAGAGADLLLARHESQGLRWLVASVAAARGCALQPSAEALPVLPRRARSWELALVAGWCALQARADRGAPLSWEVPRSPEGRALAFERAHEGPALEQRSARLAACLAPRAALRLDPQWLVLSWS